MNPYRPGTERHAALERANRQQERNAPMFAIRDLGVLQYTNGFTFWHYRQGDSRLADVARPGFFNDAADMVTVGDVILVSGAEGATELVVRTATTGNVTTAALKIMESV